MVTVTLRETYDLSTKPDKMTLIGVHTPSNNIIQRLYPGFCEQYKFFKIRHQNVRLASAARLPVDPLGVGLNPEGQVSPEDMFNPILYKACSNHTLSNLEYRIRGLRNGSAASASGLSVQGESVDASNENVTYYADEFDIYYSLLSNTKGWKLAHPQSGLSMRKLVPLVYERLYSEGVNRSLGYDYERNNSSAVIPIDSSYKSEGVVTSDLGNLIVDSFRGRPHRMPSMNTKYLTGVRVSNDPGVGTEIANGMGTTGRPYNAQDAMPAIPCIYTGIILVPPSRNTVLYYRMVVETVISFYGVQTMDEIGTFVELNDRTRFPVYWSDYKDSSRDISDLKEEENTVSASEGATLRKIMES